MAFTLEYATFNVARNFSACNIEKLGKPGDETTGFRLVSQATPFNLKRKCLVTSRKRLLIYVPYYYYYF